MKGVAYLSKHPAHRVWLPSLRLPPASLEASFSSPRSWASPFKALLLSGGRKNLSIFAFHSCTSVQNLPALHLCFSGLLPPKKPVSFLRPEGLVRVGAFLLSWAFQPLGLLPPMNRSKRHLPFQIPLSLFKLHHLTEMQLRNRRVFRPHRLGYLSPWRAPARLAFLTDCVTHPFKIRTDADYFFILGSISSLRNQRRSPLCICSHLD